MTFQSDRICVHGILLRMSFTADPLVHLQAQGELLIARIVSRDDLQLAPVQISKAAATRLRQGLRALEAYVRRVLFCLALALEPGLKPDNCPRNPRERAPNFDRKPGFKLFTGEQDCPDFTDFHDPWADPKPRPPHGQPVLAAPLLGRLNALKTLLKNPAARAKRLAFHLARYRPGWLFAPGRTGDVPHRWGPELSATFTAMGHQIVAASKARPPPIGPRPVKPPRIRWL
ncbi:MAG: hypothetical protein QNI84_09205 [Henriciella sp.]|nr:hypothetical protein [Henriciella sp.]